MAKVIFSGLEPRSAGRLAGILAADGHEIQRQNCNVPIQELLDANIVFVGGEPNHYLSLLRRVRSIDPALAFVIVARSPETSEWLDALEAGATDYCSAPFDQKMVRGLIASAIARQTTSAREIRFASHPFGLPQVTADVRPDEQ